MGSLIDAIALVEVVFEVVSEVSDQVAEEAYWDLVF